MEPNALQSTNRQLAVGSLVWVEDPDEAWLDGVVSEINGEEVTIDCSLGETVSLALKHLIIMNFDKMIMHL